MCGAQLEFIVLSNKTSRPEFAAKAEAVIQTLHRSNPDKVGPPAAAPIMLPVEQQRT
jgi:hypothetical protein